MRTDAFLFANTGEADKTELMNSVELVRISIPLFYCPPVWFALRGFAFLKIILPD